MPSTHEGNLESTAHSAIPQTALGRFTAFVRHRPAWQLVAIILLIQALELLVSGTIGGYVSWRLGQGQGASSEIKSKTADSVEVQPNFTPAPKRKTKRCWQEQDTTMRCVYE